MTIIIMVILPMIFLSNLRAGLFAGDKLGNGQGLGARSGA